MVIAIGTDIVEIARIAEVLERQGERFIDRILTVSEKTLYNQSKSVSFVAKRFAAKEAVAKALGTGIGRGVSFQDIVISNNAKGAPLVELSNGAADVMRELGGARMLLSLSDERHYALAYAVLTE
ncbi:MAG: holo-ACP synthase [Porticoccaceae bacterium]|jgi:holo-[acyl-carrier protein] synthase|nr:MAG: ACP synthase [SAR92 bacterium BACL16 MAG-120619-bin48]KRP26294.1 MAG: ACP synthase [SAR92 bacterium BACL16 MAG-120322-bin99]MDO7634530.1 holo-ACP synthase [Porticoccaceae bacterium]MDP4654948.1 holo-ACP synthase [Alphaproteobacteria bacterium]MDP4745468.1 holo-ACP synthase [Porticoccaceae bacterium]